MCTCYRSAQIAATNQELNWYALSVLKMDFQVSQRNVDVMHWHSKVHSQPNLDHGLLFEQSLSYSPMLNMSSLPFLIGSQDLCQQ